MFERICAAVTACSTFVIAALAVFWTVAIAKCSSDGQKVMEQAENEMRTSSQEMERENLRIQRQLEERLQQTDRDIEKATEQFQQKLGGVAPPDLAPPPPPRRTAKERTQAWDPSKGLPPGIAPSRQ